MAAVSINDLQAVNPPLRRRGRPSLDDSTTLGQINSDGYEVVGAMTNQMGALEDVCDMNSLEDQARAHLGALLREAERELRKPKPSIAMLAELNARSLRWLARVDILDAEQGLDKHEPVTRAKKCNRDAHAAGKRIIQRSEPKLRMVGGLQ